MIHPWIGSFRNVGSNFLRLYEDLAVWRSSSDYPNLGHEGGKEHTSSPASVTRKQQTTSGDEPDAASSRPWPWELLPPYDRGVDAAILPCRMKGPLQNSKSFLLPCPKRPDKTLHAMLIEGGTMRSCYALPTKRLGEWTREDWQRFLDYQQEMREGEDDGEGRTRVVVAHMGPYLYSADCRGVVEEFAPREILARIRSEWEEFYAPGRAFHVEVGR